MIEIYQTERAIVEYVRERTKEELSKRIPCIDNIDYRRLTYLLIEDRMAMYEEAKVDETIPTILRSLASIVRIHTIIGMRNGIKFIKQCKNFSQSKVHFLHFCGENKQ